MKIMKRQMTEPLWCRRRCRDSQGSHMDDFYYLLVLCSSGNSYLELVLRSDR